MDKPMTLNFTPVELVLYIMSVIITIPVLRYGREGRREGGKEGRREGGREGYDSQFQMPVRSFFGWMP